jgi:hypothetical protein
MRTPPSWQINFANRRVTAAAWKTKPSWYLIATADRAIPPALQRTMVNLSRSKRSKSQQRFKDKFRCLFRTHEHVSLKQTF